MKIICLIWAVSTFVWASIAADKPVFRDANASFRNEILHALEQGNDYLRSSQSSAGWWSTQEHPSVSALALSALQGEPNVRSQNAAGIAKGMEFLVSCVKPDGGIYVTNLANYNTAISLMALIGGGDPRYDSIAKNAREFLIKSQIDVGERGKIDDANDGGIGYSHDAGQSDMNNTLVALEALYYSKRLVQDRQFNGVKDLNWEAAIHFIQNCQNLPEVNRGPVVSSEAKDRGGFFYDPQSSKAGSVTNSNGKVALRSYGSISYAGLLSYAYADVRRDDPRVKAVMDWLRNNMTLEENPGMGAQGYYYYLHLMTKALTAAQTREIELPGGKKINWRHDVAMRLINLQKNDGSWQNENGRWWERDKALVTAYSVLTLEMIYRGL
jgi:squalene-hopene/tetraprenyl-beta-curcumene cyclase